MNDYLEDNKPEYNRKNSHQCNHNRNCSCHFLCIFSFACCYYARKIYLIMDPIGTMIF